MIDQLPEEDKTLQPSPGTPHAGCSEGCGHHHGDTEHPGTFQRMGPKIGRNDPCPCGSGKKYKKCCLAEAT